ncbi:MAG: dihydrodipicolinate synthase family protein [Thaumarchaeota archaeon]|nr:MAG: dihydrodipicolinate synthase family protein [Nitrososphaerota archaeon]
MLKTSGIHVTTVTPFKESFELDLEGVKENIGFLLETEISSVVPLGTVGEFASLTTEERKQVTERVVDAVNGKKTTIVGVSHTSFAEVVGLAKHAKDCGADAVLLVPPYYYRDRDDGLVSFFELISKSVDIDMVLYNVPGLSKVNLTGALLSKILDRAENIVAIKDATKDLTQLADTIRTIGKRVPVIAGAEEISYFGLLAGSPGATSAMANFAPNLVVDMYRAIKKNDIPTASSIFFEKILLFRHLDVAAVLQGFPIQIVYVKEVMNLLGMHGGSVRPPLTQLTNEKKEELKRVLEVIGKSATLGPLSMKQRVSREK